MSSPGEHRIQLDRAQSSTKTLAHIPVPHEQPYTKECVQWPPPLPLPDGVDADDRSRTLFTDLPQALRQKLYQHFMDTVAADQDLSRESKDVEEAKVVGGDGGVTIGGDRGASPPPPPPPAASTTKPTIQLVSGLAFLQQQLGDTGDTDDE